MAFVHLRVKRLLCLREAATSSSIECVQHSVRSNMAAKAAGVHTVLLQSTAACIRHEAPVDVAMRVLEMLTALVPFDPRQNHT